MVLWYNHYLAYTICRQVFSASAVFVVASSVLLLEGGLVVICTLNEGLG